LLIQGFLSLLSGSLHSRLRDMPMSSCCCRGEFWGFCVRFVVVKPPVFCCVYLVSCRFYVMMNAG
ncbi:hypothetical protein XENOCAPTIV_006304, partial [Xenoophorus captivus]